MCLTIVGIPLGYQLFKLAVFAIFPFGKHAEFADMNAPKGCLFVILNIIRLFCSGFWIALAHFFLGILFSITIIGLPFGLQHFKMAKLAFIPFGGLIAVDE